MYVAVRMLGPRPLTRYFGPCYSEEALVSMVFMLFHSLFHEMDSYQQLAFLSKIKKGTTIILASSDW